MVIGILDVVAVRLGAGEALHSLPAPLLFICVDTRPSTVPFAVFKVFLIKAEGMRGHLRRVRAARRVRVFHARRVRGHYDLDSCKAKGIGDHCGQPPLKYFCQCTQPVLQWKPHRRITGPVIKSVMQLCGPSSTR